MITFATFKQKTKCQGTIAKTTLNLRIYFFLFFHALPFSFIGQQASERNKTTSLHEPS